MPNQVRDSYRAALADAIETRPLAEAIGGLTTKEWDDFRRFIVASLRLSGPSGRIEDSEVWKVLDWCMDVAKLEDMIGSPIKDSIPYEIGVRRGLTIAQNILNGWRPKKLRQDAACNAYQRGMNSDACQRCGGTEMSHSRHAATDGGNK